MSHLSQKKAFCSRLVHVHYPTSNPSQVCRIKSTSTFSQNILLYACMAIAAYYRNKPVRLSFLRSLTGKGTARAAHVQDYAAAILIRIKFWDSQPGSNETSVYSLREYIAHYKSHQPGRSNVSLWSMTPLSVPPRCFCVPYIVGYIWRFKMGRRMFQMVRITFNNNRTIRIRLKCFLPGWCLRISTGNISFRNISLTTPYFFVSPSDLFGFFPFRSKSLNSLLDWLWWKSPYAEVHVVKKST